MQKEYPWTSLIGYYIGKFCFFSWKIGQILKTPIKYLTLAIIAALLLQYINPIHQISQIINHTTNTAKASH